MPTVVTMPKWGLTMTTGTVTGWLANEGDPVTAGAPLLTVETEKAVDDVEAPADGVLRKIVADTGSEVPVMGPVAVITAADETLSDEDLAAQAAAAPQREVVSLADGRKLAILTAGPVNANPPLVFIHGLGGSQTTWTNLLPAFADRYRVAALDLPGHGGSDKPDPAATDYSLEGLAAAVGELIADQGLAPAILIGHSLGGAVAVQMALDRPKLVRGLVLIDSAGLGPEISGELLDRIEAEPSRDETRQLLELFFEDKKQVLDRGIDDMHAARMSEGADQALKAIAAAVFSRDGQQIALRPRLAELNRPVHLIWGEHDRVVPVHHAWSASTTAPGAWLDVIEGVGHVPQVEAPAATITAINEFLAALPPADTTAPTEPEDPSAGELAEGEEAAP